MTCALPASATRRRAWTWKSFVGAWRTKYKTHAKKLSLNSIFRLLLVTKFLERRHGVFTRVTKQRARRGAGPCEPALKVMYPLNWEHALLVCFERKCNIGADNVVLDTNRQCSSLYGPENQGANYNAMKIYRELGGVIWKGVAAVPPKITYKGS